MKNKEIWRFIPNTNSLFQVSSLGNVKSFRIDKINGRLLIPVMQSGYLSVHVSINNINKLIRIHGLVAITFIPNPLNKPQVNHINSKKNDNRVQNLEWCTASENSLHSCKMRGNKRKNTVDGKVTQYDLNKNKIKEFNSVFEAAKETNSNQRHIRRCLNFKRKSTNGFIWTQTATDHTKNKNQLQIPF